MRHACFNSLGWQDIPPTSEWLDEVYAGIQAADTFLFIISPDSVVSEICTLEIEHAIQHNKRLVPVVWHDVADDQVHSAMSAHNWVFLREEDDFDANFELLIDALDTDLEHVREHTRLLTRAIEWDQDEQSKGLALSRQELTMAEGWLTQGVSKEPRPAELHSEYIAFSRATVAGWRKLIISSVAVAVIFLSGLSVFSFLQRQQAVKQKLVAEQQRTEADKQRLRAEEIARIAIAQSLAATASMNLETDPERSLLLVTESVRIMSEANETVLPLPNLVLHQSIIKSRIRLTLTGHDGAVMSAAYSPNGQRIVTASDDNTAKV
ncbi:TPA: TIR domain-containing protein [Candidatus Poribacteria bacterium]|nr:TIR domain-containing protein [Candidatus Poribacteria bacterium]